ncbi:MAG TPA: hypothetical protein VHJ18_24290 [Streptosporangiaceae bacterium]|nr:hypothetical protein [Streptosporangiaceae bacterium]
MSQPGHDLEHVDAGRVVAHRPEPGDDDNWADLRPAFRWLNRGRAVLLVALLLIAGQVAWRAQFLSRMYFYRADFSNLDLAINSPFNWHYLTYVGTGHVMLGERAIIWVLARISLYNWTLASAVTLAFLAAAGLAAFGVLRALFGERPAILAPLAIYLLAPLGVAALGWWTVALESVPLQLAIFMALNSHIHYVRTRSRRHLIAASAWVVFGMLADEKGLVVPVLLFAVTSAFGSGGGSWLAGVKRALQSCWRAWASYAVAFIGYLIVLMMSLRAPSSQPQVPNASAVLTFGWGLLKNSLLPGVIGGPWGWLPLPGHGYALAAAPDPLIWIALIVAVTVVIGTILRRKIAWRAWMTFAAWVLLADMLPIIFARLNWYPVLLALDTRYVADAMPVLVICLGLAFLPVADRRPAATRRDPVAASARPLGLSHRADLERVWRTGMSGVLGVIIVGSIWSAGSYQSVTTGRPAAEYIASVQQAISDAPPGAVVLNSPVPDQVKDVDNGARAVAGAIRPGKLHWISQPRGTIDGLQMFGLDGRLYPVWVYGASTGRQAAPDSCWPQKNGRIVMSFWHKPPYLTTVLRIGYLWAPKVPGMISVAYGGVKQELAVRPGLHTAFLPVSGSAPRITVSGLVGKQICIGDAEAGSPRPLRSPREQP